MRQHCLSPAAMRYASAQEVCCGLMQDDVSKGCCMYLDGSS